MRRSILIAAALAVYPVAVRAQQQSTPSITAVPLSGPIHLDGVLDEPAWQRAQPAHLATQINPDEGKPPTEPTDIRIIYGDNALYIGARMYDDHPERITARLARRDERPASDRLTIRLDARHDQLTAFLFDVFPAGNKGDAAVGADGFEDYSWDAVWDMATRIDSAGWVAEIRIPLDQLRYNAATNVWGIQIRRFIQRKQEEDVFSYVPRSENEGPNRYGRLLGLDSLPQAHRLEVIPYITTKADYSTIDPANPFRDGSQYTASTGADLRMGLTSDLTLDATINPDFGQVEVDPAVVNLSDQETVFDEKRPFFVEGSDLFNFGQLHTFNSFGTPSTFFSRRIGRPPQGQINDPNAQFTDVPGQTTIAAAAKVTGKLSSGWSIAALEAVTPRETARWSDGGGAIRSTPVEPFTNYLVTRVQREFSDGNTTVGGLATAVNRDLSNPDLALRLRSSAYLGGVDFHHFWDRRNWALDASFASSRIAGSTDAITRAQRASARYMQRPDAEHLGYDTTRTSLSGYALQLAVTKISGGHWGGNVVYQEKSPGYETNDVGLTQFVGERGISTDTHYEQTRPGPIFHDWIVGLGSGNGWNYDGDKTTSYLVLIANSTFRNFWQLNGNVFYFFSAYDDGLTRGGPQARRPAYVQGQFELDSDQRGILSWGARAEFESDKAGTWSTTYGVSATLQPGSNLRLTFEPNWMRAHDLDQYVTAVSDPTATSTFGTRTVFATVERRELALDTRLDWIFTPRLSLQLYVQPLISAGDYRDYKEFATPRKYDFDVYGKDRGSISRSADGIYTVDPDGTGPAQTFSFADQNFNFRSLRANLVLRWEFRPGSTLFVVWQQARQGAAPIGSFAFRRDFDALLDEPADNRLAVKVTYWLGL
ncbi:MAG TPA: DUF5916 domain-containing protein [Gemmatimonadales bacterium]|nr:DUF5916 domain-containing protein [Gemmatimonadales bacterium]